VKPRTRPATVTAIKRKATAAAEAKSAALPPTSLVRQYDTHRLISTKYRPGKESVLARITDDDAHFADVVALDDATNDRLLAEVGLVPGIGVHELVFGIPCFRVINASFCHPSPLGSRFNGPDRGAWYAAFSVQTAQAEIVFHRILQYAEIGRFEDCVTYDDYLADFSCDLHDLRAAPGFAPCLARDSYIASQELAERLLAAGSLGVVYPSVRHRRGTCIACFRPSLVGNVRHDATYRFTWSGKPRPLIEVC
jgi:hypothetical protein